MLIPPCNYRICEQLLGPPLLGPLCRKRRKLWWEAKYRACHGSDDIIRTWQRLPSLTGISGSDFRFESMSFPLSRCLLMLVRRAQEELRLQITKKSPVKMIKRK
jgi:hypothetical protein